MTSSSIFYLLLPIFLISLFFVYFMVRIFYHEFSCSSVLFPLPFFILILHFLYLSFWFIYFLVSFFLSRIEASNCWKQITTLERTSNYILNSSLWFAINVVTERLWLLPEYLPLRNRFLIVHRTIHSVKMVMFSNNIIICYNSIVKIRK